MTRTTTSRLATGGEGPNQKDESLALPEALRDRRRVRGWRAQYQRGRDERVLPVVRARPGPGLSKGQEGEVPERVKEEGLGGASRWAALVGGARLLRLLGRAWFWRCCLCMTGLVMLGILDLQNCG